MTKADLIAVIAEKLKFPLARAELLVDVVFDCMERSMSRGEKIEIRATRPNYPYTQAGASSAPDSQPRLDPAQPQPPTVHKRIEGGISGQRTPSSLRGHTSGRARTDR
jgi:hypothetical protein